MIWNPDEHLVIDGNVLLDRHESHPAPINR